MAEHRTESEGAGAVTTVGRWPWRSASAKKRVTTYPPNRGVPKMDGADLWHEAPGTTCGRRARPRRRSVCAGTRGGAGGADLGSSSISRNMQRRVRPRKEVTRRLRKGTHAETRGAAAVWRHRRRRQQRSGGNLPARASGAWCGERRVLPAEKDAAGRTEPHQGSGVCSPAWRRRPAREVGKLDG